MDDPATLAVCLGDPRTFLTAYPKPLLVDGSQLGGDTLLRSVKSIVDEDLSRGQYLLTGSTRFLTVPSISEALAGRAGIVDLWHQISRMRSSVLGTPSTTFWTGY